jgi:hypothetical protein
MRALVRKRQTERGLSSKGLIASAARQLDAALPLLGKFQPLMRQLFVVMAISTFHLWPRA